MSEFWGIEVKGDEPVTVETDYPEVIHLSQAVIGEGKGDAPVVLSVNIDEQKIVIGILSDNIPQLHLDLFFERDFELSHNSKNRSVHLCGYKMVVPADELEGDEEEDPFPQSLINKELEKAMLKSGNAENSGKPIREDDSGSSEDEDDEDDDEDESDDEEILLPGEDSDSEEEDDTSEDKEDDSKSSKLSGPAKKRPLNPEAEVKAKKVNVVPLRKTDGKKGGDSVTPRPSKEVEKNNASFGRTKAQASKHAGKIRPRKWAAIQKRRLASHTKAKRSY